MSGIVSLVLNSETSVEKSAWNPFIMVLKEMDLSFARFDLIIARSETFLFYKC